MLTIWQQLSHLGAMSNSWFTGWILHENVCLQIYKKKVFWKRHSIDIHGFNHSFSDSFCRSRTVALLARSEVNHLRMSDSPIHWLNWLSCSWPNQALLACLQIYLEYKIIFFLREREREFRAFLKQNDWFRFTHSFSNSSCSLHAVSVLSVTHRFTDSIELFVTESSLVTLFLKSHVKL